MPFNTHPCCSERGTGWSAETGCFDGGTHHTSSEDESRGENAGKSGKALSLTFVLTLS